MLGAARALGQREARVLGSDGTLSRPGLHQKGASQAMMKTCHRGKG
jgi:hypothetical protein